MYLGDPANQANFKRGLADFSAVSGDLSRVVLQSERIATEALTLIEQIGATAASVDQASAEANTAFQDIAAKVQSLADSMAITFKHLDEILQQISAGKGTAGRVLNDPKLYEALVDTTVNLQLTVVELRELIKQLKAEGLF